MSGRCVCVFSLFGFFFIFLCIAHLQEIVNSPGSNCSWLNQMCKKYIRAAEARLELRFFMNWGVAADALISCFVSFVAVQEYLNVQCQCLLPSCFLFSVLQVSSC